MSNGVSVASTMGFTAVDGLPMGTRCGSIDPGVILYLMDQRHGRAGDREVDLQRVGPARRIGDLERHAHAARLRRPARESRLRSVRLSHRTRAGIARRARFPASMQSFSPEASARTRRSCGPQSAKTRRGSASQIDDVANASDGPRIATTTSRDRRVGDSDQRRAHDRAPHAARARGLMRLEEKMLKGKSAIVTGSTSGIGLGIARALAADGANVMLNGFGDAGADRKAPGRAREGIRGAGRVQRRRHVEARTRSRRMVSEAVKAFGSRRHSGQQRRHPAHRARSRTSPTSAGTR